MEKVNFSRNLHFTSHDGHPLKSMFWLSHLKLILKNKLCCSLSIQFSTTNLLARFCHSLDPLSIFCILLPAQETLSAFLAPSSEMLNLLEGGIVYKNSEIKNIARSMSHLGTNWSNKNVAPYLGSGNFLTIILNTDLEEDVKVSRYASFDCVEKSIPFFFFKVEQKVSLKQL